MLKKDALDYLNDKQERQSHIRIKEKKKLEEQKLNLEKRKISLNKAELKFEQDEFELNKQERLQR